MILQSKSMLADVRRFLLTGMLLIVAPTSAAAQDTNTFPGSGNAGVGTTTFDAGTSGLQIRPASRSKFGVLVTDTDGSRSAGLYIDSDGFGQLYLFDSGGTIRTHIAASGQDPTYFNSGGNVGIGTATPSQKLNVIGNGLFGNLTSRTLLYSSYDSQQNPFLEIGQGTSHSAITPFPVFVLSNNTTSTNNAEGIVGQIAFANRSIADNYDKRTAIITSWVDGASNSGTLQFYTNSAGVMAERLRINSTGNVGIGTSSPGSYKLNVNGPLAGTSTFTSYIADGLFGATALPSRISTHNFNGGFLFGYEDLGLGDYSPRLGLQQTYDVTSSPSITTTKASIGLVRNGNITIKGGASHTEFFRIDNSGNVGVGTTTPGYKLDVNGEINATGIRINGTPISGGGSSQWTGTNSIYYNGGNVGIGSNAPAQALHVQRDQNLDTKILIQNDSSGTLAQADIRVKNNAGAIGQLGIYSSGHSQYGALAASDVHVYASSNLVVMADNQSGVIKFTTGGNSERVRIDSGGNVGIGTATPAPGYKLDVNGNTNVTGNVNVTGNINAKYQDLAEWVPSSEQLAAGTVVVLDTTKSNQVVSSTVAYDTRVAGVISAQPGITLGERGEDKVLVATTGRVRVKADASRGPIRIGDLLVTSDLVGVAMKSEAVNLGGVHIHRPGTIIGKALEPLAKGSGEILVLLSLQ